jgi:hypothetical protein
VGRSDKSLNKIKSNIKTSIKKLNDLPFSNDFEKLKSSRIISELVYQREFLETIINSRKYKYSNPVP